VPDVFKNLALDAWYKAFVYIGGLVLVTALFVPVKVVTNGQVQLLALGVLLIGIGEWKNHKYATWIKPPNAYTGGPAVMSTVVRKPDVFGIVCDVLGVAAMAAGIASIAGRLPLG
jgi:hypothetical protein